MKDLKVDEEIIKGTRIVERNPEFWEISLLVPKPTENIEGLEDVVEYALFRKCMVRRDCCDYFGLQSGYYEWFFIHPSIPKIVYNHIVLERDGVQEATIDVPSPIGHSNSDSVFLTMNEYYYRQIEEGKKDTEDRVLTQYYCNKLLSPGIEKRYVKFNKGYKNGQGNQMKFEIKSIRVVSMDGEELPARDDKGNVRTDFGEGFEPIGYRIYLGKRIY